MHEPEDSPVTESPTQTTTDRTSASPVQHDGGDDPFVYDDAASTAAAASTGAATADDVSAVTETVYEQLSSRRGVLSGLATAGLAAVGFSGAAAGQHSAGAGNAGNGSGQAASLQEDDETTDVDILNYALTLEHLEYNFYQQGLERFDDCELRNAHVVEENLSASQADALPDQLAVIRDHEGAHVDAIAKTVKKLGGEPVQAACYDFGYETPSEFLGVAKVLENTGVAAYAGAAPSVKSDAVLKAAVSIHSVEARHAASLNALNGVSPFPDAFDAPKTMEEVTEAAGAFIVECE